MEYVIIVGAIMVLAYIVWSKKKQDTTVQPTAPYKVEKSEVAPVKVEVEKKTPAKTQKTTAKKAKVSTKEPKLKRSK